MQPGSALKVRDVTDSMWESLKCPKSVIEIKDVFQWVSNGPRNTHGTTKHNSRLADEAVGAKSFMPAEGGKVG